MRDWRRYSEYSGGFMLEKCCHDLDLYNGLVGTRPLRVASFGGRKSFVPSREVENDVDVYQFKPSGWMGSDKVFSSDGTLSIIKLRSSNMRTAPTFVSIPT